MTSTLVHSEKLLREKKDYMNINNLKQETTLKWILNYDVLSYKSEQNYFQLLIIQYNKITIFKRPVWRARPC